MNTLTRNILKAAILPGAVGTYVLVAGSTGFCPACEVVVNSVGQSVGVIPVANRLTQDGSENQEGFDRVNRPGSVNLEETYDTSNPEIPLDEVHTLLPKDAIPALTDPKFDTVAENDWLDARDRVIVLEGESQTFALPLAILDMHEIVNMTFEGEPVAATYCPLCDSATVISRKVTQDGKTETLEFGVSGALYNSNVLMYDRTHKGLWSQLAMKAVTGPMAGTQLDHLPVRIRTWGDVREKHPDAKVLSRDTGHNRPYGRDVYERYFSSDDLMVPVRGVGDDLDKKKTLGLGVLADGHSWFITADAIGDKVYTLDTPRGEVRVRFQGGGIDVLEAPEGVHTAQTFYYSWSAFNPKTTVISASGDS